nr:hypothetical protein Itr_chr10CG16150 [Ipomoea trifida]
MVKVILALSLIFLLVTSAVTPSYGGVGGRGGGGGGARIGGMGTGGGESNRKPGTGGSGIGGGRSWDLPTVPQPPPDGSL